MAINSVSMAIPTITNESTKINPTVTSAEAQQTFANTLKDAISKVNDQQIQSDTMTEKLINGGNVDLHEVMIASQKASSDIRTRGKSFRKLLKYCNGQNI